MKFFRLFIIFTLLISTCVDASSLTSYSINTASSINARIEANTKANTAANITENITTKITISTDHLAQSLVQTLAQTLVQGNDSLEQQSDKEHLFVLPRIIRASATEFNALAQLNPNYFVEIEFFSAIVLAALFKNLANPPLFQPWFIQQSFTGTKQRLSGWKESNTQFTAHDPYSV